MIFFKTEARNLAKSSATVLVEDNGEIVRRTVVGTFAIRMGRSSKWGVNFSKPLSDGCNGVTVDFIIDEAEEEKQGALDLLVRQIKETNKQEEEQEFKNEVCRVLLEALQRVSCSVH